MIQNVDASQQSMWELARRLYPIHRTLVNAGFRESLAIIRESLPLRVLEYPSGRDVWGWTVPNEWVVEKAFIADERGRRIVDFHNNNLHLSAYSQAIDEWIPREELLKHLNFLPDQPDAIPYNTHYYVKNWSFNIAHNGIKKFKGDRYRVVVKTRQKPGVMNIGEFYLPGESKKEILISTYLCHPSMANDNLSGVVVGVELFKWLMKKARRRFSYRLLLLPETIGSIAYMADHPKILKRIVAGYTVYICGDPGPLHYKRTYQGNAYPDRVAAYVMKQFYPGSVLRDYSPVGSDERQFNAPGVRLPIGAMTRTPPGEFHRYHTSKDNLTFIQPQKLLETLEALRAIVNTMEQDVIYKNLYKGEPFFSKYRFQFPSYHSIKNDLSHIYFRYLAAGVDGQTSLLDMAERWNIPLNALSSLAHEFERKGLIAFKSMNAGTKVR